MKLRGPILICLLLIMLIFTACGQSESITSGEEPSAVEEATVSAVAEATETSVPTEEPTEELVDEPVESEEATVTEESTVEPVTEATSENCLTCHSDKEQLIDTAAPEPEETESSESSGVG